MANPTLEALKAQVQVQIDGEKAAKMLILGFNDRMAKAVADAIANGATAAELAPITQELADMKASADELAVAVVANTPAASTKRP